MNDQKSMDLWGPTTLRRVGLLTDTKTREGVDENDCDRDPKDNYLLYASIYRSKESEYLEYQKNYYDMMIKLLCDTWIQAKKRGK